MARKTFEQIVEAIAKMSDEDRQKAVATGAWKTKRWNEVAQKIQNGTIDPEQVKKDAEDRKKAEEKQAAEIATLETQAYEAQKKLNDLYRAQQEGLVQSPAERAADKKNDQDKGNKSTQSDREKAKDKVEFAKEESEARKPVASTHTTKKDTK